MAVPKKKTSHRKTRQRASHHNLKNLCLVSNAAGNIPIYSHHVSSSGVYKGKVLIAKLAKRAMKKQQKNQ